MRKLKFVLFYHILNIERHFLSNFEIRKTKNLNCEAKSLFFQWDKCWPTTNVNCDLTNKTWTSYNLNNTINFVRHYTYETK